MSVADSLPETFEGRDKLARFNEVTDLGTAYLNLEKKLGSSVSVPPADATEEQRLKFHARIGVPQTVEGYSLPDSDAKEVLSALRDPALKNGVTPEAWNALTPVIDQAVTGLKNPDHSEVADRWDIKSRELFGDRYEELQTKASSIVEKMVSDSPDLGEFLKDSRVPGEAAVMQLALRVADLTANDSTPSSNYSDGATESSMKTIAAEAKSIVMSDEWKDKRHPLHSEKVDRYNSIIKSLIEAGYESGIYDSKLQ